MHGNKVFDKRKSDQLDQGRPCQFVSVRLFRSRRRPAAACWWRADATLTWTNGFEKLKKHFCRAKTFRRYEPEAGSRFTIALRVWLLPRQSLPLWCQLTARPGGGAIGKQRQAPVSCSAVDKLRSNSKLTLVRRQRLVEKRKMQKPFKERRSYGEHLVVFQICQGCEILKFMQTPFQWKMQWGQIENISTMLKVRNSRLSVAPWISLRIQSLGCWDYWLAASAMNPRVFLFAW